MERAAKMVQKLMLIAAMVGAGFVQGAQEDWASISLLTADGSPTGQEENGPLPVYNVAALGREPSPVYDFCDDFFDEEQVKEEALRVLPLLIGEYARLLVEEGYLDIWNYSAPVWIPSVYRDLQAEATQRRTLFLQGKKQEIMRTYIKKRTQEASFVSKVSTVSCGSLTFRQVIESSLRNYLLECNRYGNLRNRYENLIDDFQKRIEAKCYFDMVIVLIKEIHRKLLHDKKNFFRQRSVADKREIYVKMDALDFAFRRISF